MRSTNAGRSRTVSPSRRAAKGRPRLVATFHGGELGAARESPVLTRLLARLSRGLDVAIANSSHTASLVRELAGIEPAVIPSGPLVGPWARASRIVRRRTTALPPKRRTACRSCWRWGA